MRLKPMDKNTLAFLKDLVVGYGEQLNYDIEGALTREHFKGFRAATRQWLCVAMVNFMENYDGEEFDLIIPDFMEAIKNADTDQ